MMSTATSRATVIDTVRTYKLMHSTFPSKFNDPEYGPEILFDAVKDYERDLLDAAAARIIATGKEYGEPNMADLIEAVKKLHRERYRLREQILPRCSMCAQVEDHGNHDAARIPLGLAHPFSMPAPKRENRAFNGGVAELRALKNRGRVTEPRDRKGGAA